MSTKKNVRKWVDALRSGRYRQTRNALQNINGYCCLGVACDIFISKKDIVREEGSNYMLGGLPEHQRACPEWLNKINKDFSRKTDIYLSTLNDEPLKQYSSATFSFDEIADLLQLIYLEGAL